ncbi:Glycosyltransferase [Olavius algarvensis associated proteobacterium Delta 3]|nr:Glycosyltransferase [Olavius algarvensis associated proteobacterium Delta 3]CAB5123082.1 Glycosyltransferase [Olavius algarvensis associated proteobacterium Delta 3]
MNKTAHHNVDVPLVVAVVLTWNDTIMTTKCIETLFNSSYENLKIVVVDNGSNPPACPILKNRFPDIIPVQLSKNWGFTGGCNRGIEKAIELGAKYVFLLNNDTLVGREAIPNLIECMENNTHIGLASAILLNPETPKTVQAYRGWIDRDKAFITRPGYDDPFETSYRRTVRSEFVSACAILMRTKTLSEVGLFDESLFTNWEDYDLCIRCTDAGWELAVVGTAEVVHRRHQTTGSTSPFITYFATRNRLICLFRYGNSFQILKNSLFILRSFFRKVKMYGFGNIECHRAFIKAWFDFILGVRGEGKAPANRDDKETGIKTSKPHHSYKSGDLTP